MTGIIKVDTIQNNGGTTGLTIDSTGRVKKPNGIFVMYSLHGAMHKTALTLTLRFLLISDLTKSKSTKVQRTLKVTAGLPPR